MSQNRSAVCAADPWNSSNCTLRHVLVLVEGTSDPRQQEVKQQHAGDCCPCRSLREMAQTGISKLPRTCAEMMTTANGHPQNRRLFQSTLASTSAPLSSRKGMPIPRP